MPKTINKINKVIDKASYVPTALAVSTPIVESINPKIAPITQDFGGDMNILRDKINEIISKQ